MGTWSPERLGCRNVSWSDEANFSTLIWYITKQYVSITKAVINSHSLIITWKYLWTVSNEQAVSIYGLSTQPLLYSLSSLSANLTLSRLRADMAKSSSIAVCVILKTRWNTKNIFCVGLDSTFNFKCFLLLFKSVLLNFLLTIMYAGKTFTDKMFSPSLEIFFLGYLPWNLFTSVN